MKHGGGSVMVWGDISMKRTVPLKRITGIMNKEMYHSLLSRHAIPNGLKVLRKGTLDF